ncbi:MAG: ABC transporter substrate-binding protein [Dehalococcoidales bacterium]|nr:ABC transporter substrate-binding protein [Dehalococcoidales bacterium]
MRGYVKKKFTIPPVLAVILTLILVVSCSPEASPVTKPGYLADEVVFFEEPDSAKAVRMIEAGEMQVYASGLTDAELVRRIKDSQTMGYETSYGLNYELTFNPVGPTFPETNKLNPFSVPEIREAINWLIDRNYIAEEIYEGLAVPRYFPLSTAFPDYARLANIARRLEITYAPDPSKAKNVIAEQMEKLGAAMVDGKWQYQGEPVELIFLIRPEDKRRDIGNYVATLLEETGFVVDRQYKSAAEASPIWIGDPAEGRWHIYTGGWISTVVSRDQAGNFSYFYTPRGRPELLWQAYTPAPELDSVADTLARRDYQTLEERQELLAGVLRLAMKDSARVWLVDTINVWPRAVDIAVTADLAGGISASALWPYTLHFNGREGGTVRFGSPGMLTEPWNPVAGTNWIWDLMIIRGAEDNATLPDPFTGLYWPNRIKSAEVYVEEGLPVTSTLDWVNLSFLPSIPVPEDAWIDWDVKTQQFITVGEKYPEGLTARTKTVVHYVDDIYLRHWHDGTNLSLADFVLGLAFTFDRANEESTIFDEADVPAFESFVLHFRGARIVQEDPLVVEVYKDIVYPDAEWIASSAGDYFYSTVPWHILAPGILAEADRKLAFSSSKADRLRVEWMNYISGPSLAILEQYRLQALNDGFIPYPNVIGKYVTAEEAKNRYTALGEWYQQKGHFWVSNGPFYVESVHPVEKTVVLKRSEEHITAEERWLAFTKPKIAQVAVSGPSQVKAGSKAEFRLDVTFEGESYLLANTDFVKFLVFDGRGELAITGDAESVRDGRWQVILTPDQTERLQAGANRLEIIVAPLVVSIPSFESFSFATVP